jgi:hypothetical protein
VGPPAEREFARDVGGREFPFAQRLEVLPSSAGATRDGASGEGEAILLGEGAARAVYHSVLASAARAYHEQEDARPLHPEDHGCSHALRPGRPDELGVIVPGRRVESRRVNEPVIESTPRAAILAASEECSACWRSMD